MLGFDFTFIHHGLHGAVPLKGCPFLNDQGSCHNIAYNRSGAGDLQTLVYIHITMYVSGIEDAAGLDIALDLAGLSNDQVTLIMVPSRTVP